MPIVDRREFGGRFTVKENARRLANYRYLEVQLMEMLGGWSHTTPHRSSPSRPPSATTSMTMPRLRICWASDCISCVQDVSARSRLPTTLRTSASTSGT
jgi:hypothetical protein